MSSVFSKIISGEIPSFKIGETDNCFAFLDISPLAKGHVLVVPKTEVDYIFDLESELYVELNLFAKKIAGAIKIAVPCKRVGVAVIGLEVPHAHIHLIPLQSVDDINFSRKKMVVSDSEQLEIVDKIKSCL